MWQALDDFRDRIARYEEVYETITDRNLHYIKLIDMCGALAAWLDRALDLGIEATGLW